MRLHHCFLPRYRLCLSAAPLYMPTIASATYARVRGDGLPSRSVPHADSGKDSAPAASIGRVRTMSSGFMVHSITAFVLTGTTRDTRAAALRLLTGVRADVGSALFTGTLEEF